jgi:probable phosphoglycerate mutase
MNMRRVILVRHGETEWNRVGRYQGFARTSLNEHGRWQARQVAERLAGRDVEAIYASDLPRARETAGPIAARLGLPLHLSETLRENDVGEWEGLTVPEIQVQHPDNWAAWLAAPLETQRGGGESLGEMAARVAKALECWQVDHVGKTIVAVTHGGPIKALVCLMTEQAPSFRLHLRIGNASITNLVRRYDRWYLESLNDRCHLLADDA